MTVRVRGSDAGGVSVPLRTEACALVIDVVYRADGGLPSLVTAGSPWT